MSTDNAGSSHTFPSQTLPIHSEPITKKGIQRNNRQIHLIYCGKNGQEAEYIPVAKKTLGSALGTIYEKVHTKTQKKWIGKIREADLTFANDPHSTRTRTKKSVNLDGIREKLAMDVYGEFGRDLFTKLVLIDEKENLLKTQWT
jgi:hypothetical protein